MASARYDSESRTRVHRRMAVPQLTKPFPSSSASFSRCSVNPRPISYIWTLSRGIETPFCGWRKRGTPGRGGQSQSQCCPGYISSRLPQHCELELSQLGSGPFDVVLTLPDRPASRLQFGQYSLHRWHNRRLNQPTMMFKFAKLTTVTRPIRRMYLSSMFCMLTLYIQCSRCIDERLSCPEALATFGSISNLRTTHESYRIFISNTLRHRLLMVSIFACARFCTSGQSIIARIEDVKDNYVCPCQ